MKQFFCFWWAVTRVTFRISVRSDDVISVANSLLPAIAWLLFGTAIFGRLHSEWSALELPNISGVGFLLLFFVYSPYRIWAQQSEKVERFEREAVPKVATSSYEHTDPKGARGKAFRTWRLRIRNVSSTTIENCTVTKKSFTNRLGHESSILGIGFKLTTDQPTRLQEFQYQQSFDIHPGTEREVDIAAKQEWDEENPRVFMLYAIPGGGGATVGNAILDSAFPHRLVIQISAKNMVKPEERTYELSVDAGRLRMKELS